MILVYISIAWLAGIASAKVFGLPWQVLLLVGLEATLMLLLWRGSARIRLGSACVLMLVLGAGFGLGVAVTISRLLAGAAPRLAVTGLAVGAVVGLLLAVWVVSTRGLLHDRAVLDRWIGETTTTLEKARSLNCA